jgi:hypothetical protein
MAGRIDRACRHGAAGPRIPWGTRLVEMGVVIRLLGWIQRIADVPVPR